MLRSELRKAIRNHHYDWHESGLYLPRQGVIVGGVFTHDVRREGEWLGAQSDPNLMVTEGLTHLLNVLLHGATPTATWYVALFEGNYTPVSALTAAAFNGSADELTAYDQASHPAYDEGGATGAPAPAITNAANKAEFTINATVTCYGAALLSTPEKPTPAAGNILLCASRFSSARALVDDDALYVTYTITAQDA